MGFKYVLTGDHTDQPTVYKLYFGKKYYTWKGKMLKHSVETVCNDIHRFIGRGCGPDHLLKKVLEHITRARVLFCRVEVLLQTDNLVQLIDFENKMLAAGKEDPDCLNVKFEAHIPKWISDHGQENESTQNKPLRDTISLPHVSKHQPMPVSKVAQKKSPSSNAISLMDALEKLKNK